MLKEHFYFRLTLNILVGAMYVYALYNMARHTTLKEQPSKKFFTRILGWFFITLGVITSIASIYFMLHISYPVETLSGYDAIIHTSTAYPYWGYPTDKQASVLTTLLNSFLLLGVGSYSLAYKKTDNSLWKKATQFGLVFLLSIAMYSASNFHYFDWPEFIAPSLFLSIWCFILIKYKKNDKNRQDILCEITEKKIPPCTSLTQEKSMAIFKSETKIIVDKEDPEKIGKDSTETDIQHCKHCGKKIEPDSIFCKYCGRKVSQSIGFTCFLQHSKQFCKNIVTKRFLFFSGIILVLVIFGICMYNAYITEIRPKHKAEEILFREREELSKLDGDDLIWKCHYITLGLGIPRTGNKSYDEYVRQVLTERAKEVLDSLEMEAQNDNPAAQYAFARYYLTYPGLLPEEGGEGWSKYKLKNKDAARGAYWYLRAAMNNHAEAQYNIGICFEIGNGVRRDIRQAINWYQKSARNGLAEGQLKMGDWFRDGYKQKIGEHWEKDQNKKIDSYEIIVQRNLDSAFVYWKKAAEQGSLDAKKRLEQIYPAEL